MSFLKMTKSVRQVSEFFTLADGLLWVGNSQSTSGLAQNSTDWLSSAMNGHTNKNVFFHR